MEEKERYEVKRLDYSLNVKLTDNSEPDWRYIIFDNVNDKELAKLETVCDWLNQKDKRIKELEEEKRVRKFWYTAYQGKQLDYGKLNNDYNKQEKLLSEVLADRSKMQLELDQLKQQLKEYSELGTPKEIDDTYRSRNILNINLQDVNRIVDDLVKQLHDLPKKIVCEISEAIERLSWRKRIYTNWEFDKEQLYKDLDTILEKYGG